MLKNFNVGETIRICTKVEDFCGENNKFLYLLSGDIENINTQCTISCARANCAYGCIDTTNRLVTFKSVMSYSSSNNDVRCENVQSSKQYKTLGSARSDSKGISTLTYKITEQDKLDYQDAIANGGTYDIVCCIDDELASGRNAIAFKGLTIGEAQYTDTIKINIRPWGWYTPEGAVDQIVSKMSELNGKLIDYFSTITDYEYIKTDIIPEGSDVTVNIRLKKTNVLSMQLGIVESVIAIVILILAGIGLTYLIRWITDSQTTQTTSPDPNSEPANVQKIVDENIKICLDALPPNPTCSDIDKYARCIDLVYKSVYGTVISVHTNSFDLKDLYTKYLNKYTNIASTCNPANPKATLDLIENTRKGHDTEAAKAYNTLIQSLECWIPNPANGCLVSRQAASSAATLGIIVVGAFVLIALARR